MSQLKPVLTAIIRLQREHEFGANLYTIGALTQLPRGDVLTAIRKLQADGLVMSLKRMHQTYYRPTPK